jgi:uncharacterized membrane protein YjgN (DUF898 family)
MNRFNFSGKGWAFFKIAIVNFFINVFSLTLLLPLTVIRECRYLASATSLGDIPFRYTGLFKTYFRKYLKTFLIFMLELVLAMFLTIAYGKSFPWISSIALICIYFFNMFFYGFVAHGSMKFHAQNFQWNSTGFSWKGRLSELVALYSQGFILCMLTLNFYYPWFETRLNQYYAKNLRFGGLHFEYTGNPVNLFKIYLKSILLGILTLGIYNIWSYKSWFNYTMDNILIRKGEHSFKINLEANTLEVFELVVGNLLLVVLTLGFGTPLAIIRKLRFIAAHCYIPEALSLELIEEVDTNPDTEPASSSWLDKWDPQFII